MNICLFTSTSDFGGTERMALEFLRGCDRARFQPSLMCLLGRGPLLEAARRDGIPCLGLDWKGALDLPRAAREFRRFIHERRIELIHSFGLRAEMICRPLAHRYGVKYVVSGIRDVGSWRRGWQIRLARWTGRWVDLYIANSEMARQTAIQREKVPPAKIITIHNGIRLPAEHTPTAEQTPRSEQAPSREAVLQKFRISADRSPIIVQVANLRIQIKGYDLLLEAVRRLKDSYPRLLALSVGKDYEKGALQGMIDTMGLADHVRLLGYCENVSEPLALADVAVLPSRSESFPVSIIEAMAMRLPVVAARVGGIPEIITNGVDGFLIPSGDAEALATRLRELFADSFLRARLGAAARQTVEERFSLERMIEAIQNAYLKLGHP
ncbi:MAG: glycosyltransferase [Candidatus Sumerlaeota bacterium]|nr:glycosyltransferase [Candidatus Sumerlaeota bacterium]